MATSGSKSISVTAYDTLKFSWARTGYSIPAGESYVHWKAELIAGASGRIDSTASKAWSMTHGGVTERGYSTVGIAASSTKILAQGDITCKHDSSGNFSQTWDYYQYFDITFSGTWISGKGVSLTVTLDNLPKQAYLTSAPNFTDEENPTISYSNPSGAALSACISLTGAKDDVPYRSISATAGSFTFELTEDERATLRAATTGSSRTVYFYLRTYIGGVYRYSYLAKTFTIINGEPTITATVYDVNEQTLAFTGDKNILIQGYSTAQYHITAKGRKGAAITSYKAICGDAVLLPKITASGSFPQVQSGDFILSATDSRGQTATITLSKTLKQYFTPTCNIDVEAPTTEGETTLNISGIFYNDSFGKEQNGLSLLYRYKANSADYGEWLTATPTADGNNYTASIDITGLNYQNSYTFQARVADSLNIVESPEIKVKTVPIFDWGENDFNFNVPVTVQGKSLDYIVEQGTSNGWHYTKWASGKAECWQWYEGTVNLSKNLNGAYYTDSITVQYPFTFTDNVLNVNGGSHSHINWARAFADTATYAAFLVIGNTSQSNVGIAVHLHAVGTWK